jgi:hypothetical protein
MGYLPLLDSLGRYTLDPELQAGDIIRTVNKKEKCESE